MHAAASCTSLRPHCAPLDWTCDGVRHSRTPLRLPRHHSRVHLKFAGCWLISATCCCIVLCAHLDHVIADTARPFGITLCVLHHRHHPALRARKKGECNPPLGLTLYMACTHRTILDNSIILNLRIRCKVRCAAAWVLLTAPWHRAAKGCACLRLSHVVYHLCRTLLVPLRRKTPPAPSALGPLRHRHNAASQQLYPT